MDGLVLLSRDAVVRAETRDAVVRAETPRLGPQGEVSTVHLGNTHLGRYLST